MANVTDAAFRRLFAAYGKPDVLFTEFVSVDGLLSLGQDRLLVDLWFTESERPIVAQIFGAVPEHFQRVAALIADLGFDGIDINMGCPDRSVEKQGGGAALINNPVLAAEIIQATKRGAPHLPVSVKTRIGYKTNELSEWLPVLLAQDLAALTVHLRTRRELSDVPAHWDLAPDIVALRDQSAPQTKVLGNGDVASIAEAHAKVEETGLDGVMIGRAAFGKPWFFAGLTPPQGERLRIMTEHAELFEQLYLSPRTFSPALTSGVRDPETPEVYEKVPTNQRQLKQFATMKKHFKAYATDFDGAKELRMHLMDTEIAAEVRQITQRFVRDHLESRSS